MIRKLLLLFLIATILPLQGQVHYETINSNRLDSERELKIQLPRNYETNTDKKYPVIITLDGDYLFEPMAGNVDMLSYWQEMPEAIVVGVNHNDKRREDLLIDEVNYLPTKTGADFFEFLGMELMPYLAENYRISDFNTIAGHDATANFLNYYLFKDNPIFDAYINLSPELAPQMTSRLVQVFKRAEDDRWFYLATSEGDDQKLREGAEDLDNKLTAIDNPYFHYRFEKLNGASHFGLAAQAIPLALQNIFKDFRPITYQEYENKILTMETSPFEYLLDKYEKLEDYYNMEIPYRKTDLLAIGKALEFRQNWDDLEKLGDLAQKEFPGTTLGTYYLARAYEAYGRPRKALKTYQSAYGQEEVSFMTIDFMLDKAEQIKKDFGY